MTLKGGKGNNATVKEVSLHKDKEKVIHDTNTNTMQPTRNLIPRRIRVIIKFSTSM